MVCKPAKTIRLAAAKSRHVAPPKCCAEGGASFITNDNLSLIQDLIYLLLVPVVWRAYRHLDCTQCQNQAPIIIVETWKILNLEIRLGSFVLALA